MKSDGGESALAPYTIDRTYAFDERRRQHVHGIEPAHGGKIAVRMRDA
jgi:hypothetical protein